ncbi:SDR family oxidoreductase [Roseicella aerolata]|uniref:SDR family oxidoreductase n=1 Tax=Roseicella aerolata TaxID=2883479 RepID=A0A9X1IGY1_9PROT|nr:SDR family oxidoreductase [Roseicella aerolata]MCB4824367.1 SDR family oxidoreductase [Roseicella aerolata]
MSNTPTLLVVGASGAAATRVTEQARTSRAFNLVGLSRRVPEGAGDWVPADLTDPDGLRRALATRPDVTHIVYASRAPFGEGGVEDVPANLGMLRNLLDAAEASLPRFAHIHMIHGGKWYGLHIGPFRTPAREDDPRHLPPNFYYDQQDLVAARQEGKAWSWSASRPNFVLDVAPGRARNMVSTLGAYAAICRELGVPFDFPGKPGAWERLHEVTDAGLLAQGVLWMLTEPRAANRAFNITNGDCFRWCDLWPFLADRFGLPCGVPRPMPMPRWMADKGPVWEAIRRRHGLLLPIEQVASWDFADFFLGMEYDVLASMTAARKAGFTGFVDSWEMFAAQIEGYRAARVLPPR